MKYILSLIVIFACSELYAQALGAPRSHNQLTGTGANSHATIDTFIASKGQASGIASLDASGNVIQPTGTVTGMVKQTNGTASGTVLTSVSIVSGTGTLSNANLPGTVTLSILYSTDTIELNPELQLQFKINDIVKGVFSSTGLSIGDYAPSYSLDVFGTASVAGNLIQGSASSYHYFGGASYGIRDNGGLMQFMNSGGSWGNFASSTSGGGWQDDGTNIRPITVTDTVTIGSTTSSSRQLTCVGSSTLYGQVAIGSNTTIVGGLSTLLDLAIGDNDTGLKWVQDGDLSIYGNGDVQIKIDGNNDKVLIGTTTSGTVLNVGGTVTAEGFSGNGGGLTNVPAGSVSLPTGTATIGNLVTNVITGSSSAFCYAYQTGSVSVNSGTWTNIALNADTGDVRNATHTVTNPEQIKVLVPGMYEVSGRIQARINTANVAIRICKNNETEVPGSLAQTYLNYGDGSTGACIAITPLQVRLATNDYVYMQVAHNQGSPVVILNYLYTGMPAAGTATTACLSVRKIGD